MRSFLFFLTIGVFTFIAAAQETVAPRTASYGLFEISGSGVRGNLQIAEDPSRGDLEATVTLVGITEGQQFIPAIFRGECGPDRPFIAELPPVGSFTNDPYVSLGHLDLSFEELTGGDYFMFIFPGDTLPGENEAGNVAAESAVACGEVGAGANR